jgi:putative ABC transport system permease protein
MRPLTALKYFWQNKRRAATVFVVLLLAVSVVSFITSLVTSLMVDANKTYLDGLLKMSYISPTSSSMFLSDSTVKKVNGFSNVDHTYNVNIQDTTMTALMGNIGTQVFIPDKVADISKIMRDMDVKLSAGRLPSARGYEIAMSERLLKNKGLKIGDYIGSDVNDQEYLNGKYRIVGSLKGESIVSLANKSTYIESLKSSGMKIAKSMGMIVISKAGKLSKMNKQLASISSKTASVTTYDSVLKILNSELASANTLLTIIIIVVVFIISLSIGAMIYIVYMNRSEEFGILHAIGYRKSFINNMIFKELVSLSAVCWVGGYLFSWLLISGINKFLLQPKGQALYFFSTTGLLNTLIIPVMVVLCATVPIFRKLKKWDPIAVIERRE